MRTILLVISYIFIPFILFAQKKPLDFLSFKDWPEINGQMISNDGKYAAYRIETYNGISTLVVQATDGTYKKEISAVSKVAFTADSKRLIILFSKDSLGILLLERREMTVIAGASDFSIPKDGNGQWLIYNIAERQREVNLYNLFSGKSIFCDRVTQYKFSGDGSFLLLGKTDTTNGKAQHSLDWVDLQHKMAKTIVKGIGTLSNIAIDPLNQQLAILRKEADSAAGNVILYFKTGMDSAVSLVDDKNVFLGDSLMVGDSELKFSKDGSRIFLSLVHQADKDSTKAKGVITPDVDIWSYNDKYLQSQQEPELKKFFSGAINIANAKLVILDSNNDDSPPSLNDSNDEYVLISTKDMSYERDWNTSARPSHYVVSTRNGERKLVQKERLVFLTAVSPAGKYVIYYDREEKNYFTYEIKTNITRNITDKIKVPLYMDEQGEWPMLRLAVGVAAWLKDDAAVLIYDRYDIWEIDPKGIKAPRNVTMGYGRKNKIILRYIQPVIDIDAVNRPNYVTSDQPLLLTAFNRVNKENGFYSIRLSSPEHLEKVTMVPYIFYYQHYLLNKINAVLPVKAKNAEGYLVQRMSATEFPNLYFTKDFKTYAPLTNLRPQESYNWLTTELVHWNLPDGEIGEGILYKPENFDPQKKYPVIFHFYEKDSDERNNYLKPKLSDGTLSIPWFVSNGYIVLDPNIYYKTGETAKSITNSLTAAVKYLSSLDWVDTTKLGVLGFSFGSYEVNVAVTNTHFFAAAVSCDGWSDLISGYGGLGLSGNSLQFHFDYNQVRLGSTLWQEPERYIENSPIFKLANVTTPLLIMHNKDDLIIPWQQGIELFTGLRRLRKKVWMLQYDGEGHGLMEERNQLDFSMRLAQFFGHYLKGEAAPEWMTEGVPKRLKGKRSGLTIK